MFQSGHMALTCHMCMKPFKFFKMVQSFRPHHRWTRDDGQLQATLLCIDCEVVVRELEWSCWTDMQQKEAGLDYVEIGRVKKEQKARSKEAWYARSEVMVNAKASLKALREYSLIGGQVINVNFCRCTEIIEESEAEWQTVE